MSLADYAAYESLLVGPHERLFLNKDNISTGGGGAGFPWSFWLKAPNAGSAPGAAAACDRTTAGALGQLNQATSQALLFVRLCGYFPGTWLLCDRLSHQSGLDGTVTTAQTTNLPTAALTRYTDGVGVMALLEVYTQIGATATTVTCEYTNDAGTTGRVSPAIGGFGNTNQRETSRAWILPLQQGDRGVRAVASVTLAASTGTAGNFGVTLFRPLVAIPASRMGQQGGQGGTTTEQDALVSGGCQLAPILSDACLFWLHISSIVNAGALGVFQAELRLGAI